MSERKGKKEGEGNYPKCSSLLFSAEQEKRRLWGPSCWNKLMMYMFTRGCLAEKKEVRKNVCGSLRWVYILSQKASVSSGTCHRSSTSANAGSPWKQISKAASNRLKNKKVRVRVRVSLQSQLPHAHHFVTHTLLHDTSLFLSKTPALPSCQGVMGEIPLRARRA